MREPPALPPIKSNMRCIETGQMVDGIDTVKAIKSNMRCIETGKPEQ